MSDPSLPQERRETLVRDLMTARRAIGAARASGDRAAGAAAKAAVDGAKRGLGERGDPWWTDDARDWNRHLAKNTPYAAWAEAQIPPGTAG